MVMVKKTVSLYVFDFDPNVEVNLVASAWDAALMAVCVIAPGLKQDLISHSEISAENLMATIEVITDASHTHALLFTSFLKQYVGRGLFSTNHIRQEGPLEYEI